MKLRSALLILILSICTAAVQGGGDDTTQHNYKCTTSWLTCGALFASNCWTLGQGAQCHWCANQLLHMDMCNGTEQVSCEQGTIQGGCGNKIHGLCDGVGVCYGGVPGSDPCGNSTECL